MQHAIQFTFFLRGDLFSHYTQRRESKDVYGTPGEPVYWLNPAAAYLGSWEGPQERIGGSGPPAISHG